MSTLVWTDTYALAQPRMDATHREFVALLAGVEDALEGLPDELAPRYDELVAHTVEHFAQEERWMAAIGFAPENCHAVQHRHVLNVLREVQAIVGTPQGAPILRRLVAELAEWFPAHAQMMDSALAETMQTCGFDTETGVAARPLAPAEPITGCGVSACG